MSYLFTDENGDQLTSSSILQIMSDLETNGEVLINFFTDKKLSNLGVYITSSSSLGELDHPAVHPPETDFSDLLHFGMQSKGLCIVENDVETFFSFNAGNNQLNRILLADHVDVPANSSGSFKLRYVPKENIPARRLYINIGLFAIES